MLHVLQSLIQYRTVQNRRFQENNPSKDHSNDYIQFLAHRQLADGQENYHSLKHYNYSIRNLIFSFGKWCTKCCETRGTYLGAVSAVGVQTGNNGDHGQDEMGQVS
jgi:hypothetical protein